MAASTSPSSKSAKTWGKRLESARKAFDKWEKQGEQIIKRYRDERDTLTTKKRRFNILWSNIQVLTPALYGRPAKPEVSRRFKDGDTVGRVAAAILERALEYDVEQYNDFDTAMKGSVEDRLLPGRGTSWIRYEPHITTEAQVSNAVTASLERVTYECAPIDYVNWRDFLHNPCRTWDEVWWVSRDVWMTKDEGGKRFGKVFADVPLEYETTTDKGNNAEDLPKEAQERKAKVTEIWDRKNKKVVWVAQGFGYILDERPDPLKLEGFFPCPKPLFATTTTGSMVPVPDYCEYQDQAEELDIYTQRISILARALKVAGVYNGEFKQLQRLLNEGVDNTMIGVDAWAAFAEKGGMQGAIAFLPIKEIAEVIVQLVTLRQNTLSDIWQIMGLSDIMRGSTNADETLGAQELKAQFGSMRLKTIQGDVAQYASAIFRLKAEVMCKHFDPKTLIAMSGAEYLPEAKDPNLIAQAIQLLKQGQLKDFRISVESDSLAQIDEAAEKKETAEFITSMGSILKEAGPVVAQAPTMMPFIGEIMLLACRKQRAGRSVEMALEQAIEATKQAMQQGQANPEQLKQMQAEIEKRAQEVQKGEQELMKKGSELEMKAQKVSMDETMAIERINMATEKQVFEIESAKERAAHEVDKVTRQAEAQIQEREMLAGEKQRQAEAQMNEKVRVNDFKASERERELSVKEKKLAAAQKDRKAA